MKMQKQGKGVGKAGLIMAGLAVLIALFNIIMTLVRHEDIKTAVILMAAVLIVFIVNLALYRPYR